MKASMLLASRFGQAVLATVPVALTPLILFALAEGWVGAGGGERDVLLAVPWFLWTFCFAVCGYVLIYRDWPLTCWPARAAWIASGFLLALWLLVFVLSWL